jgi:predicted LPLAT superfamily acyltransferase
MHELRDITIRHASDARAHIIVCDPTDGGMLAAIVLRTLAAQVVQVESAVAALVAHIQQPASALVLGANVGMDEVQRLVGSIRRGAAPVPVIAVAHHTGQIPAALDAAASAVILQSCLDTYLPRILGRALGPDSPNVS